MRLDNISLYNFRNYQKLNIDLNEGLNFFVGNNGSGKTNLLEAIYFLALAKSYKTNETNLIRVNNQFARISSHIINNQYSFDLKIIISEKGKKVLINDKKIKKLSDYIGNLKVLSFLPEDIMIIKSSPKDRRYFIDIIYGQIDRYYLNELSNYKLLLKQRNELLKQLTESDKPDMILLDVITEQLSISAGKIISFRKGFVKQINNQLQSMYQFITDKKHDFVFTYNPSVEENIEKVMKSKYKTDLLLGTTNIGPHRDDYEFLFDNLQAKNHASQGEQRIMILGLIFAIANIIYNNNKERPVFLLDDVFSELDSIKQNKIIKYLIKLNAQTIITTTSLKNIEKTILQDAKIFKIYNNAIREEQNARV